MVDTYFIFDRGIFLTSWYPEKSRKPIYRVNGIQVTKITTMSRATNKTILKICTYIQHTTILCEGREGGWMM